MRKKVVAIVGMAGSGKSEVARIFERHGYARVRFGDVTDLELKKRGLEVTEANERRIREQLRRDLGMAAYALLTLPHIDTALTHSNVVADGLYSWEEYLAFQKHYQDAFFVLAVFGSPRTRCARLNGRTIRPLEPAETASRDRSEIENLNKGGPIAVADFTIVNEGSLDELRRQTENIIHHLENA